MIVLKVSATQGIVTIRIGSRADRSAGCPWGGVVWISNRRQGTEFNLWSGCHSHSSPTMLGKSSCSQLTHSLRVFLHKMESGNPITTFSVTNLQIIAAATEVKVFPRLISSTTSAPSISASQTHLLTMNHMTQTWRARHQVPGRPGIQYLWPGTWSSVDWQIGWAFSSLTALSRYSCSNSLLILLSSVFNTQLVFAGSRTSSPSSPCTWTTLAPLSVCFSSSMIPFSCSYVRWADGLIFRRSWNSSQCSVFHREVTIRTNIYGCNTNNSILSIRPYIHTSMILLPTILCSLLSSPTLFRTFQTLCILISSCAHLASTRLAGIT